jgi:hypothetical protein
VAANSFAMSANLEEVEPAWQEKKSLQIQLKATSVAQRVLMEN